MLHALRGVGHVGKDGTGNKSKWISASKISRKGRREEEKEEGFKLTHAGLVRSYCYC